MLGLDGDPILTASISRYSSGIPQRANVGSRTYNR